MRLSIRLRRNGNPKLSPVPMSDLGVAALDGVPGVTAPKITDTIREDAIFSFVWSGPGMPKVTDEYLQGFGLSRVE
ncbi:hypothetical protein GLA29479_2837 [Lysobacter antibioticus]|jgi:hypothetical protein|uniref:Uncharacterized protein n=2 Tax=Lysobacter TaxID=68 RepID=A0A0S2F5I1_LYSAN|nr:hypothetical protein GLA29479_2837 [Lysobacter antibioticus]ALN78805.1 hypothetical protein LA76x_0644 [Lysobacter antibioticus]